MPDNDQNDPFSFQHPTSIPEPCRLHQARDLENLGREYPGSGDHINVFTSCPLE